SITATQSNKFIIINFDLFELLHFGFHIIQSITMVANTEPASYQAASASLKLDNPTTSKPRQAKPAGPRKLFSDLNATYGDWRDDLQRDGYAVVKGAIPKERADQYGEDMMSFLENL
ncbi:hypothetical protein ACHAO7_012228, partial [Fusarium culmorum]